MIIYHATKQEFLHHALRDDIEEVMSRQYQHATGTRVGRSEFRSWKHSLLEMAKVLQDEEIPANAGIAIEYRVPATKKRIDFVITGEDDKRRPKLVIVELKQWSSVRLSEKDGLVWAVRGSSGVETEDTHPCYQAWSYACLLHDFSVAVQEGDIALRPCAYLHNHPRDGVIDHEHYRDHIEKAPLFLKSERDRLQTFIRQHVRHGDSKGLMYVIDRGRIRPSKMLADAVAGMLQGKLEFVLLDDQKVVYETVLAKAERATNERKQVVIVQGGPGTGKSVVAINLLAHLIAKQRNARYVSKNAAPRAVYEAKLTGTLKKSRISNLFSSSGVFFEGEPNQFDVLVVDEAHRLNAKSGIYGNLGENQVKEIIAAARCSVFFVDDDQQVTLQDVGHSQELKRWAHAAGAELTLLSLSSQFRCNGSDGYMAWLDDTLQIRETANNVLDTAEFDFRVFDNPAELHELIEQKNKSNNRARMVAGYCWEWSTKKDPSRWDIEIEEFDYRRRWNLVKDGSLWIMAPESVSEVGCIHTSQGLELDYVGVIIGPDLVYRDGRLVTQPKERAKMDASLKGLGKMMKSDPHHARATADRLIKNTYRTLMTRGMRGCYVHCTDSALAAYLRSRVRLAKQAVDKDPMAWAAPPAIKKSNVIPWPTVSPQERANGAPAVPVFDLRIAAGGFSDPQALEEGATTWVAPPDWVHPQPGLFVAQVVGESMNRVIPNGSWCLFRLNPVGTRQGKIVVVQHRDISDPETGGRFTIKRYSSEKVVDADGDWRHQRVTLKPESDRPGFEPIVIEVAEDDEFVVVAQLLTVLEATEGE
ncbi:MAG: DNA/RNA helicase domain-containing protein [Pseudomonadota bacterium]